MSVLKTDVSVTCESCGEKATSRQVWYDPDLSKRIVFVHSDSENCTVRPDS